PPSSRPHRSSDRGPRRCCACSGPSCNASPAPKPNAPPIMTVERLLLTLRARSLTSRSCTCSAMIELFHPQQQVVSQFEFLDWHAADSQPHAVFICQCRSSSIGNGDRAGHTRKRLECTRAESAAESARKRYCSAL